MPDKILDQSGGVGSVVVDGDDDGLRLGFSGQHWDQLRCGTPVRGEGGVRDFISSELLHNF